MSESILYYPTINIQDGQWLRSAALYWDEVCSIVPYKGYKDISAELLYLQERGYYRPIYPQDVFILGNSHEFSNTVRHQFSHMLNGQAFLSIGTDATQKSKKFYNPDITCMIHYNKIPQEIIELFTYSNMVRVNEDGWLEMNSDFADCYMRTLAEFIVSNDKNNMVLGSDNVNHIHEIYPKSFSGTTNEVISLTLEKCLPVPTSDVGFEELLDFKEEHRDELMSLQLKISELEQKISKAQSANEIKREIEIFKRGWELELVQTETMFKESKIQYTLGSLRSFVQDAGAVAGLMQLAENLGHNISTTIFTAAIGIIGAIGLGDYNMNYRNGIRSKKNENGFAYIVSANEAGLLNKSKNSIEII